jgi:hypothetical protein
MDLDPPSDDFQPGNQRSSPSKVTRSTEYRNRARICCPRRVTNHPPIQYQFGWAVSRVVDRKLSNTSYSHSEIALQATPSSPQIPQKARILNTSISSLAECRILGKVGRGRPVRSRFGSLYFLLSPCDALPQSKTKYASKTVQVCECITGDASIVRITSNGGKCDRA